jgi:hypothetical protein
MRLELIKANGEGTRVLDDLECVHASDGYLFTAREGAMIRMETATFLTPPTPELLQWAKETK